MAIRKTSEVAAPAAGCEACSEGRPDAGTGFVGVRVDPAQAIRSRFFLLDFNQLMTPDHRIDSRKLALALLKSPMKIVALLRLQRQSAAAARRLAEVLGRALQIE